MRPLLAHVTLRGTLRERSVEPVLRILRAVRERNRFRGVLLDISSGGGAAVASHELFLAVRRLNAVKPVVASIDCGSVYDPMARALEDKGIPTFRSADVAVKTLGLYVEGRLKGKV